MMFHGLACHAVLDWEDVALGSPLSDLGRWLLTDRLQAIRGRPTPRGIPNSEEIVSQWESESGRSAADLRWFQVLNCCFAAGTLARSRQLQVEMLSAAIGADAKGADAVELVLAELFKDA